MSKEKTLCLIKPDAVKAKNIGNIIAKLEEENFNILSLKMLKMDKELAGKFYEVHKGKHFYESLVEFMTSGTIVAMVLEKEDAIKSLRNVCGNTDSRLAKKGTIRNKYGTDKGMNAIHASDSYQNAKKEISIIFG